MLSDDEIVRRLSIIRYSPQRDRYARRAPSINGISTAIGVSREYLFRIIRGERIGPHARAKLSHWFSSEAMCGERTADHRP